MTERDTVIFRKDKAGVFALFPELPGTNEPRTCTLYQHIGQHGAADYHACILRSKAASIEEYAPLKGELESIGYVLDVKRRASLAMHTKRWESI